MILWKKDFIFGFREVLYTGHLYEVLMLLGSERIQHVYLTIYLRL